MKYISTPIAFAVVLVSCTKDLKQYQTSENAVTTTGISVAFLSKNDISGDNALKAISPGEIYYLTGDTITLDNSELGQPVAYAKVTWGDSSAYIQADQLIREEEWKARVAEEEEAEEEFNNSDYGDPGYTEYDLVAKERGWSNGDDPIPEDQYPGVIKKYFIMEDSTEMDATGFSMENAYPYSPNAEASMKSIKAVRFEVTLNRPMDLRFAVESYYADDSEYNTQFTKIFNGAEANKPYSVVIGNGRDNMVLCSVLRATIFAGDVTAAATVIGSCGD